MGLLRTLCEYLVSVLSVLYTIFVLIFHRINSSPSAINTMPCAHQLNLRACVLIKELQTVAERKKKTKKKTKPKFQLGRFLWKARVITSPQKPAIHNINILNIERKTSIKYLGIYLDEHLNWKTHIAHVQGKLTKNLGILNQLRNYLNLKMLRQLYSTLIYPYLNYGAMC